MQKSLRSQLIGLNSLTALAFAANFLITQTHFQLNPQILTLSCLSICVIPVYQFIKTQKVNFAIAAIPGMAICLFFFTTANVSSTIALFIAMALSVTYNRNPKFGWRNNPFLKVGVVALVWTLMSVLIPFLLENVEISFTYLFLRFLLFCVQILLFEIADIPTDKGRIQSVPQLVSVTFLKTILALTAFTALFFLEENLFISFTLSGYLLFLIVRIAPDNRRFADVFVEAFPILYLLLKGVEFL